MVTQGPDRGNAGGKEEPPPATPAKFKVAQMKEELRGRLTRGESVGGRSRKIRLMSKIEALDVNNDGELDAEELADLVVSEQSNRASALSLNRLLIFLLVMLAAMSLINMGTTVGQCKLDPSLKATRFQPLKLRFHSGLST